MAKSLQEQLLEAGAVDKSRATKLKKAKHKQAKQRARGSAPADELKAAASQAQAEKTARDRELSRQRQAVLDEKAIAAQVRQLIERNSIDREGGEIPYNFSDQGVVKKLYITQAQQAGLADGRLAITRLDDSYVIIAAPVAAKIMQRSPAVVLVMNDADEASAADDVYADYEIPDDLTW